jgi:hypothetical protein
MAVAALRVVAQQVRLLFRQQGGSLAAASPASSRANRVLAGGSSNGTRPVPTVRVAEVHGLASVEDRGARPQLVQPATLIRAGSHVTVAGHHDDHPVTLGRQPAIVPPVSSTSSSG